MRRRIWVASGSNNPLLLIRLDISVLIVNVSVPKASNFCATPYLWLLYQYVAATSLSLIRLEISVLIVKHSWKRNFVNKSDISLSLWRKKELNGVLVETGRCHYINRLRTYRVFPF